jgi:hypothetical protein
MSETISSIGFQLSPLKEQPMPALSTSERPPSSVASAREELHINGKVSILG